MSNLARQSGIAAVGTIPWGAHFCQFYRTEEDLTEILVPYFEAGLRDGESCLWVTGRSLDAQKAEALMTEAMPEFKKFISAGQMSIVSMADCYQDREVFDADAVLQGWIDREADARARGFAGLRLSGDTIWVERSGWTNFMEYEKHVNATFRSFKLVALCTYCMDSCSAADVIDVCCHHQFALARREGQWELLESASLKLAKEELLRLNGELESRVDARTAELSAALRSRDEFLAMLGHELRNPLAPIRSASEVIRALTPSDSLIGKSAQVLHRQVGHLTRLVDDLLDVARVTRGHILMARQDTALADILAMAIEQARPLIEQRGHALSVALPGAGLQVHGDSTRLAQVFGNLLHNAAKFTPHGGQLGLAVEVCGAHAVITVSDSGAGIPATMLGAIFELFAQLPRSLARSEGGLGIGLTLARRIIEMHDGAIEARSDGPDQGSQFVVRLPLAPSASMAAPAQRTLPCAAAAPACNILLVDDNGDARDAMSTMLALHGHEVHCAQDGRSALQAADAFKPGIVILDIGLPDIDGYEVARRLRAVPGGSVAKIIALTGHGQPHDLAAARAAGIDAHLLKPARMEDVLGRIASFAMH